MTTETKTQDIVFSFDVAISTHALIRLGILEPHYSRVLVTAPNRIEAALVACLMAGRHGVVTALYDRI